MSSTSKAEPGRPSWGLLIGGVLALALAQPACTSGADDQPFPPPSPADHLDPASCQACHQEHYDQWAGSMHAYAADDPVFRAMNARGQRETDGELGDFCVRCHAPVALMVGATEDGLNLDEVPRSLRGVTCVYCHSAVAKTGEANAALDVRLDGTLRGGFRDPEPNAFHRSAYSPLHARDEAESSDLCGPCHDVVTPAGIKLERTYIEWQESIFNAPLDEGGLSCAACHMPGRDAPATSLEGSPVRRVHDHRMPGIDLAAIEWPDREGQREAVERFLDTSVYAELCVEPLGGSTELTYTLENLAAGHAFPSGAAQDRRVWVELRAYFDGELVFERGVVPEGTPVAEVAEAQPDLWQLRDFVTDEEGEEAHMFWEVAHVDSQLLPVATPALPPRSPELHLGRSWLVPGLPPDRVEVALKVRPMGLEILQDLVDSGDLDPAILDEMPTFTPAAARLTWTEGDDECVPAARLGGP